jgi:hypothetical protein
MGRFSFPSRPPAPTTHPNPPSHPTNAPTATVPPAAPHTSNPTLTGQHPPVSTTPPHQGPPAPSTHPTPTPTPNAPTPPRSMFSRVTGGIGNTLGQAALFAAIPVVGGGVMSMFDHRGPPSDPPSAVDNFLDGAGDAGHWLLSIPGDIRHGIENSANTVRNVTYLLTAGVIIGGAIWAYRRQ